jgi:hypothetical protein
MGVVHEEASVGSAEGRYERGGHEAVHEVELFGPGYAGPTRQTEERWWVQRDRPRRALHRYWRLHVQLPPTAGVRCPSHQPRHALPLSSEGFGDV